MILKYIYKAITKAFDKPIAEAPKFGEVCLFGHRALFGRITTRKVWGVDFVAIEPRDYAGVAKPIELVNPKAIYSIREITEAEFEQDIARRKKEHHRDFPEEAPRPLTNEELENIDF